MDEQLNWPIEASLPQYGDDFEWNQAESNICLDFHGDPLTAKLVVFSDGNHHMALEACCKAFCQRYPEIGDIFYATTPPKVILESVLQGGLMLGNLHLSIQPDVCISPSDILEKLVKKKLIASHQSFSGSRGFSLLVKKGNSKNIIAISDLLREDVRLIISNPISEATSHAVYKEVLLNAAMQQGLDTQQLENLISSESGKVKFTNSIHHREVPNAIFNDRADVAIVYYHLALRYKRIFPDYFEAVDIQLTNPVTTNYHIGLMNNANEWGNQFIDFMMSGEALNIYTKHGLTSSS